MAEKGASKIICFCGGTDAKCPHPLKSKLSTNWNEIEKTIDEAFAAIDNRDLAILLSDPNDAADTAQPVAQKLSIDNFKNMYSLPVTPSNFDNAINYGKHQSNMLKGKYSKEKLDEDLINTLISKSKLPHINVPSSSSSSKPELTKAIASDSGDKGSSSEIGKACDHDSLIGDLRKFTEMKIAKYQKKLEEKLRLEEEAKSSADDGDSEFKFRDIEDMVSLPSILIDDKKKKKKHLIKGQGEVAAAMIRLVDTLGRKLLPWQATRCPCAVETMNDIRQKMSIDRQTALFQSISETFLEKISSVIEANNKDIINWIETEQLRTLQTFSANDATKQGFFDGEYQRIEERIRHHVIAAKVRVKKDNKNAESQESNQLREQLVSFRQICRSESVTGFVHEDIRNLYAAITSGQNKASAESLLQLSRHMRKVEEAHEFLCCIGDNALVKLQSDAQLDKLVQTVTIEKDRYIASYQEAKLMYETELSNIFDYIDMYVHKVKSYSSSYMRRESLVVHAFTSYVSDLIQAEVKPNNTDAKRGLLLGEKQCVHERSLVKIARMKKDYNMSVIQFDQVVFELKENFNRKIALMRGRLKASRKGVNDVANKSVSSSKDEFAKYVKRTCDNRLARVVDREDKGESKQSIDAQFVTMSADFCASLRFAIDKIWIKQHLRERRMYEAIVGRLERIEKVAVMLWNKNAHLAVYSPFTNYDWMAVYRAERDDIARNKLTVLTLRYTKWRPDCYKVVRFFVGTFKSPLQGFVDKCLAVNTSHSLQENIDDLNASVDSFRKTLGDECAYLLKCIQTFESGEVNYCSGDLSSRYADLIKICNLKMGEINGSVNNQLGSLKDMESDLENAICTSLMQQEVEMTVFEQMSCSKLYDFFTGYKIKFAEMRAARDAEHAGLAPRSLVKNSKPKKKSDNSSALYQQVGRFFNILEGVKTEIYREFSEKVYKSFEKSKKSFGEGRRRSLPGFMSTQIMLLATSWFWDQSNLAEMCVGRKSCGDLDFLGAGDEDDVTEGMPVSARAIFGIGFVLSITNQIELVDNYIQTDDIMKGINGPDLKKHFVNGLLLSMQKLDAVGMDMITAECLWFCTVCGVLPPEDTLRIADSKSNRVGTLTLDYIDPVDLVNSIISIDKKSVSSTSEFPGTNYDQTVLTTRLGLDRMEPIDLILDKIKDVIPASELTLIVAILSRPDRLVDLTSFRLIQMYFFWRKLALMQLMFACNPPTGDYPNIYTTIVKHAEEQSLMRKRAPKVFCSTPVSAIKSVVDWITSMKKAPISALQALCVMSRVGTMDPWLENPRQATVDIVDSLQEFLLSLTLNPDTDIFVGSNVQLDLRKDIFNVMSAVDINRSGSIAMEFLRSYVQRQDMDFTSTQTSLVFWCLCNFQSSFFVKSAAKKSKVSDSDIRESFKRERISTYFDGNTAAYMEKFATDVCSFLDVMPKLDAARVIGSPAEKVGKTQLQELVSILSKLDPSSRTPVPPTACVWISNIILPITSAICGSVTPDISKQVQEIINPLNKDDFHKVQNAKLALEISTLNTYFRVCNFNLGERNTKKDESPDALIDNRSFKVNQQIISWRDAIMDEWAESLYTSRQKRYQGRAKVVKNAIDVYFENYKDLKNAVIADRKNLTTKIDTLLEEFHKIDEDEKRYIHYNTDFLKWAVSRLHEELSRAMDIMYEELSFFVQHCGSIKRRALRRVAMAMDSLRRSFELGCSRLLEDYTHVHAKAYFDNFAVRTQLTSNSIIALFDKITQIKEHFVVNKDAYERTVTFTVNETIIMDRSHSKTLLDSLFDDSSKLQETISKARIQCSNNHKRVNENVKLRVEKAIRECRKLRFAADSLSDLQRLVIPEIRSVLYSARTLISSLIEGTADQSFKTIKDLEVLRAPCNVKMEKRIGKVSEHWAESRKFLVPEIANFENESFEKLKSMKSESLLYLGEFRDREMRLLVEEYRMKSEKLKETFRDHFVNFDLEEGAKFQAFNNNVRENLSEIKSSWGPSKPTLFHKAVQRVDGQCRDYGSSMREQILTAYVATASKDMYQHYNKLVDADDIILDRAEISDLMSHTLIDCSEIAAEISDRFVSEKNVQIELITKMGLQDEGDWIRPQVAASMDLLLAAVDMNANFGIGYQHLMTTLDMKCDHSLDNIDAFVEAVSISSNDISIVHSGDMIRNRLYLRDEEVDSLVVAAKSHINASDKKVDALLQSGVDDIAEWKNLALQLLDNVFDKAEEEYMSEKWASPPGTPRLEFVPNEADRTGKVKALMKASLKEEPKPEPMSESKQDSRPVYGPDDIIELQDGWMQSFTVDGTAYYYNKNTKESLWDIPMVLKRPRYGDAEGRRADATSILARKRDVDARLPFEIDFSIRRDMDGYGFFGDLYKECSELCVAAVDVALTITSVIRSHRPVEDMSVVTPLPFGNEAVDAESGIITAHVDEDSSTVVTESITGTDFDGSSLLSNEQLQRRKVEVEKWLAMAGEADAPETVNSDWATLQGEVVLREEREGYSMQAEDRASAVEEQEYDRGLKRALKQNLRNVLKRSIIYEDDVAALRLQSKRLKQVSVTSVLFDNKTSWEKLDRLVFESSLAVAETAELVNELKSEEGRERQRFLMDHGEDVDEMAEHFHSAMLLSKKSSKRAAKGCVLAKICTARKVQKVWLRGELDMGAWGLDREDLVEIAQYLSQITGFNGGSRNEGLREEPPAPPQGQESMPYVADRREKSGDVVKESSDQRDEEEALLLYRYAPAQPRKGFYEAINETFTSADEELFADIVPEDYDGPSVYVPPEEEASAPEGGVAADTADAYTREMAMQAQLAVMEAQDRWQNALAQTQFFIGEQKEQFEATKSDLFARVSERVRVRLTDFAVNVQELEQSCAEDIRMLYESEATIQKLYNDQSENAIKEEQLTFVLQGVERLRPYVHNQQLSISRRIDKYFNDQRLFEAELVQAGTMYDETLVAALEQFRMNCEYQACLFAHDQRLYIDGKLREQHAVLRESAHTAIELAGSAATYEDEEVWLVLQQVLTQAEMESTLQETYEGLQTATASVERDMHYNVNLFDREEKDLFLREGSWFDEHRDAIESQSKVLLKQIRRCQAWIEDQFDDLTSKLQSLEDTIDADSQRLLK